MLHMYFYTCVYALHAITHLCACSTCNTYIHMYIDVYALHISNNMYIYVHALHVTNGASGLTVLMCDCLGM